MLTSRDKIVQMINAQGLNTTINALIQAIEVVGLDRIEEQYGRGQIKVDAVRNDWQEILSAANQLGSLAAVSRQSQCYHDRML